VTRLPSLTSARFFAALVVVGVHLAPLVGHDGVAHVLGRGGVGVSFFFLLSGFVLAWSARPGDTPARFYRRRFARVWPLHAVTWAVAVLAVGVVDRGGVPTGGQLLALPLLQAWVPDSEVYFAANGVAWSLSCEMFFYALFPLVLVLLRDRSLRVLALTAGACTAVVLALSSFDPTASDLQQWAGSVLPVSRLPEFVLGVAAACAVRAGWRPPLPLGPVLGLTGAALALTVVAPPGPAQAACTIVPFALLVPALALADVDGTPTGLRGPWLVRLGEWSFALYLCHQILFNVADELLADPALRLLGGLALVPLSVAASGVLHVLVERPAERRLRGEQRRSELAL
jgi:peptidoglycan/LPS O-acetylase OafA/YrhL